MSKQVRRENHRVEVFPISPGNFGGVRISGVERSEAETEKLCQEMLQQIKRHVDGIESACVVSDYIAECEHCGHEWTEESKYYNGGCCEQDEALFTAATELLK